MPTRSSATRAVATSGTSNDARPRLSEYDRLFEAAQKLPDSPARKAL